MRKGLKQSLYRHLRKHESEWIHKGDLEWLAKSGEFGRKYLGETSGRALRKLAEEELIEHRKDGCYRYHSKTKFVESYKQGQFIGMKEVANV